MPLTRRTTLLGAAAGLSGSFIFPPVQAFAAGDMVTLEGRQVRWTGAIANNGWVGGNADQLSRDVARVRGNPQFLKTTEAMLAIAKQCDVYLANLEDANTPSDTTTELVITLNSAKITDFSNAEFRQELAKDFAKYVASGDNWQKPTDTSIVSSEQATTGGKPALSIAIRADLANETAFYVVEHLVALGDGGHHQFELTVDSSLYSTRLRDFDQMLATVRYEA